MTLAEVGLGLDTLATGGVTGMLVAVMIAFLRRTKDTDDRRDEATKMVMDAAMEREARAWSERDKAIVERDAARAETERLRSQFDEERKRWEEGRTWLTKTHELELQALENRLKPPNEAT